MDIHDINNMINIFLRDSLFNMTDIIHKYITNISMIPLALPRSFYRRFILMHATMSRLGRGLGTGVTRNIAVYWIHQNINLSQVFLFNR